MLKKLLFSNTMISKATRIKLGVMSSTLIGVLLALPVLAADYFGFSVPDTAVFLRCSGWTKETGEDGRRTENVYVLDLNNNRALRHQIVPDPSSPQKWTNLSNVSSTTIVVDNFQEWYIPPCNNCEEGVFSKRVQIDRVTLEYSLRITRAWRQYLSDSSRSYTNQKREISIDGKCDLFDPTDTQF